MNSFRVHILAADHTFYDGPCESLIIPAPDGQYGIWAGHANTICAIIPGTLRLRVPEGAEQIAAVSSGVVKIEDNDVLVLVDSAERPEDIDRGRRREGSHSAKTLHPGIPRSASDAGTGNRPPARQVSLRTIAHSPFFCRGLRSKLLRGPGFVFSSFSGRYQWHTRPQRIPVMKFFVSLLTLSVYSCRMFPYSTRVDRRC